MPQPKKNGGVRYVFDTKPELKTVLKKINTEFFRNVEFPRYLTGSLPGRTFIANVDIHKGSRQAITEDIASFFDNIKTGNVFDIWCNFFGFSEDAAKILTALTTKDGHVFQGTPTSSYLANLVFWSAEPSLVKRLQARGIRYSRYVDDVTISATRQLTNEEKRWAIASIVAMMGAAGFKPQRKKHGSFTARGPIVLMGLNANSRLGPTMTRQERSRIRAMVFKLEQRQARGDVGPEFKMALNQAGGKVGRLKQLHQREATALRERLKAISTSLTDIPVITGPTMEALEHSENTDDPPF